MRSGSERINGRLKDEFGGRHVRVRGYDKVLAHLMFGMTVLTASQLMRLIVPPTASPARLLRHHRNGRTSSERRCSQTRLKLGENTESEAASTLIRPWSRSKSRQLPCADVAASLGVLAPLRIDQSFASGSYFNSLETTVEEGVSKRRGYQWFISVVICCSKSKG